MVTQVSVMKKIASVVQIRVRGLELIKVPKKVECTLTFTSVWGQEVQTVPTTKNTVLHIHASFNVIFSVEEVSMHLDLEE